MRRLEAINALDAFIAQALAVVVPLFLVSRGVDVVSIGAIFAVMPLFFTSARVLFASVSDEIGTRQFFILNGATNVLSALIYFIANNPLLYALGKITEGFRTAAIWAVNRTAVYEANPKHPELAQSRINALRTLVTAVGAVVAGFLIAWFGFESTLIFLSGLGAVLFGVALTLRTKNGGVVRVGQVIEQIDFRKKSRRLKLTAGVFAFGEYGFQIMTTLALPLYLSFLGYGADKIGLVLGGIFLLGSIFTWLFLRANYSVPRLGALMAVFGGGVAVAVPFSPPAILPVLLLSFSLSYAASNILWEMLVYGAVKGSRTMSSDIGLMHVPGHITWSIGLVSSGLIIAALGYGALFAVLGVAFGLFSFLTVRMLMDYK